MPGPQRPLKIGLIAGEASGDILGAGLIRALKGHFPDADFVGIGGEKMQAEGLTSWFAMEQLSIMGLVEVLRHLPGLFRLKRELLERFDAYQPDIFIGIDAPDFNLRIERELHLRGVPTVHYVSPSVWAWRQGRIVGIRQSVNLMLTLLPFEAAFYEAHQVPVVHVGHPMADQIPMESSKQDARRALGLPETAKGPVIGLLPGSRSGEVAMLMDVFLQAASRFQKRSPDAVFIIPAANERRYEQIMAIVQPSGLKCHVFRGQARECMAASDAVVLASGTATLECMLVNRPMVVAYRLAPLTYWLMRLLIRTRFVALPNLLANAPLVPELIQKQATPENICRSVQDVLNPSHVQRLSETFRSMHSQLKQDADVQAAKAVARLIKEKVTF
ncbi:MAG: lipid-A-disaccharide synthase [Hahellaceae bacterium]|nr:lipid-A-disaccharide synthase [Hahellaceae bacterium]